MADLNDLSKPTPTDTEPNVLDTVVGHIVRLWKGDFTGMANLVAGMLRWATTTSGSGNTDTANVRWYQRRADGSEREVTYLPGVSIGGNAATATNVTNPFPTNTRLLFAQAAAPMGWTQVVDDNANNRMLRVVTTAGYGVGGTHSPILNNVVVAHSHGFTTGNQSADHSHSVTLENKIYGPYGTSAASGATGFSRLTYIGEATINTSNSPIATVGGASTNHTHSGTTDNGSSNTSWQPRYLDLILCTKN